MTVDKTGFLVLVLDHNDQRRTKIRPKMALNIYQEHCEVITFAFQTAASGSYALMAHRLIETITSITVDASPITRTWFKGTILLFYGSTTVELLV